MRYTREDACRAWLTHASLPTDIVLRLMKKCGSAEAIYNIFLDTDSLAFCDHFTPRAMQTLRQNSRKEKMHEMLVRMSKADIRLMSYDDAQYPEMLSNIADPPPFLFYRGDSACLKEPCIAIVGSRSASTEAIEKTYEIAYDLAKRGITIVSGLALGIDAAAHRGCLDAGGKTAGLCAAGLDVSYPSEHDALRVEIVQKGGILLGEFPPGSPALPWHFRVRNRIISGLSTAVVMMECKIRSGSMTTVHHALDQGREVFAYPGLPGTEWAEGAHQLLREGANYFSSAEDIISDLGWERKAAQKTLSLEQPAMRGFADDSLIQNDSQELIVKALQSGEKSFDQLVVETGLVTQQLSVELTMLQLNRVIRPLPGKMYKIEHRKER